MGSCINEEKLAKFFQRSLNALPAPYTSGLPNHLSLIFFVVSGLDLLNKTDILEKEKQDIINWVYSRQILPSKDNPEINLENCGFRGYNFLGQEFCCDKSVHTSENGPLEYDLPSTPNTYCALLILRILGDDFSGVNKKAIIDSLRKRQRESDGAISGSPNVGDYDLRHLFSACAISFILDDWSAINKESAIDYIKSCLSYEFAFGQTPQQEAHGGPTYCAIASLSLLGRLDVLEPFKEQLTFWLVKKQITGFCGRTNKDPDTCYAFWIGASLMMIDRYDLIDFASINAFIGSAQHEAIGGVAKEPGQLPDVMHSYLSLVGLSFGNIPSIQQVIPCLNLSKRAAGKDWFEKLI
ncbi:hypothetical protein DDB_G0269726 [Dictyostelium discoideum AX4]|uniref:Geranylgeranyl transferase type-1 subunit beta n=1 Tax=Dictyostelium discoideum TaxID=44689 RepID=PGTB1_DICDI|nr:hypothetical protein DDB_G0269726 [Dictyostelium discoideum AX4]Q55DA3.1 RecName: Full=Geranylgeranyl transferase type-1 subunit beta; AltName: Full=Geranylgeranyl transferase type I subunit beta; Short=GGTase-I-beta; AltName: Full=Type I protein geranyl-geranyltransferase subunit beta [Dictyostelium discoideum]EAL72213.1 hypothetical protein DDB_G0269726 [Dictyostelium discoideum AX4]|eukprot:XP_646228.1 hypothetical protein DDB_G0269726 [Dictyostelium discoideum AX4]